MIVEKHDSDWQAEVDYQNDTSVGKWKIFLNTDNSMEAVYYVSDEGRKLECLAKHFGMLCVMDGCEEDEAIVSAIHEEPERWGFPHILPLSDMTAGVEEGEYGDELVIRLPAAAVCEVTGTDKTSATAILDSLVDDLTGTNSQVLGEKFWDVIRDTLHMMS